MGWEVGGGGGGGVEGGGVGWNCADDQWRVNRQEKL